MEKAEKLKVQQPPVQEIAGEVVEIDGKYYRVADDPSKKQTNLEKRATKLYPNAVPGTLIQIDKKLYRVKEVINGKVYLED